jgi:hypothetical protein
MADLGHPFRSIQSGHLDTGKVERSPERSKHISGALAPVYRRRTLKKFPLTSKTKTKGVPHE